MNEQLPDLLLLPQFAVPNAAENTESLTSIKSAVTTK